MAYAGQEAITDELLEILSKPARDHGLARAFCAILKAMTHPKFSPSYDRFSATFVFLFFCFGASKTG